jgi:diguanylate cyclase (GGDEF)-like protein
VNVTFFNRLASIPRSAAVSVVLVLCLSVGWIDYATGTEVRVLPLYFTATTFGAWRLGRTGAVISAALALSTWIAAQWFDPANHWSRAIWFANIVTQGAALLFVGMIVATLAGELRIANAANRRDLLTGLRNRHGLLSDTAIAIALCRRNERAIALAFIDLDNFKQVKDRLGLKTGDLLLQVCAGVIQQNCRTTDIAARLGGDEFVIAMPELQLAEALGVMDRLRERFKVQPEAANAQVSMTIGVFIDPRATLTIESLLARADALMYEAKREGRDRVIARELNETSPMAA